MAVNSVQIETTTRCNQRCDFCPVSQELRPKSTMSMERYQALIDQLKAHTDTQAIYLNGFNEPTYDKHLIERVASAHEAGMRTHLNTNASGLTPELTDQLIAQGVKEFTVNISTIDPKRYKEMRGTDDVEKVVANVDYLLTKRHGKSLKVLLLVLERLDEQHLKDILEIQARFPGHEDAVIICPIADFAGTIEQSFVEPVYHKKLAGCLENRHKNWLHFVPDGRALLCCRDYYEKETFGSFEEKGVDGLITSDQLQQYQRWIEGEEEAPDDFMCRTCILAIGDGDEAKNGNERFCGVCTLKAAFGPEASCARCVVMHYMQSAEQPSA